MKLTEVIRRLNNLAIHHHDEMFPENEQALKIGIEAIKREENNRIGLREEQINLLPGETKS